MLAYKIFVFILAMTFLNTAYATGSGWKFKHIKGSDKVSVCSIRTVPKKIPSKLKTTEKKAYFSVSFFGKSSIEISVSPAVNIKNDTAKLIFDNGKSYKLYSRGNVAWASDSMSDANIIKDMQSCRTVKFQFTTLNSLNYVEEYNLGGFKNAYKQLIKCK